VQRFRRIAHRGWLRRAITVATFGYFPQNDGVDYVVTADVECRFLVLSDSAIRFVSSVDADLRALASGDIVLRATANGDIKLRASTGVVDVEL
jgi:hypothetical protein